MGGESGDGSVATGLAAARGGATTRRKAKQQQQQQGGGAGDAVARIGRRQQIRQPAFRQSSAEEVEFMSSAGTSSRPYGEVLGESFNALHSEELSLEDPAGGGRRQQQAWGRAAGVARSLGLVWQSVTGGTSGDGAEEPSKQA